MTAEVYSDLKGVIVELVTAEVATNVVPEIACRAGHFVAAAAPPPAGAALPPSVIVIDEKNGPQYQLTALDHFPRTLQALYGRQFGGLRSAMVFEVADLAGYRLFIALRERTTLQAGALKDGILVGDEFKKALGGTQTAGGTTTVPPITRTELDRLGALKASGHPEPAEEEKIKTTYGQLPDPGACLELVKERFKAGTFGTPRPTPLEDECAKGNADRVACGLALGLRSMLVGERDAAERHVTRAVSYVVAEVVASHLNAGAVNQVAVPVLEPKLAVMFGSLLDGLPPPDLLQWLAQEIAPLTVKYSSAAKRAAELKAEVTRVVKVLHALEQSISQLVSQWRTVASGDARLDVASFADRLVASGGALRSLCTPAIGGACAKFDELATILAPGGLMWPLVQASSRGDLRTVAQTVIASIFSAKPDTEACRNSAGCTRDVFQRFATSLALYLIDMADGATSAEATRAAFRAAAVEMIRNVSPRGYTRSWIYNIHYPDFALRLSWNGGYVDEEGSPFRYIASMPLIVFRPPLWYTDNAYAAVHVSLLDPLAALSELALRPNNVEFTRSRYVGWNVISPRVDVMIGMPALSSHLTLGIGASLRLSVPYDTTPAGGTPSFEYRPLWHDGTSWARSIEVGFAVKYML